MPIGQLVGWRIVGEGVGDNCKEDDNDCEGMDGVP